MLTVSPKSWKRQLAPRSTPAVTGPLFNPMRNESSTVSGPRVLSSSFVRSFMALRMSFAKRAIVTACFSLGSGTEIASGKQIRQECNQRWEQDSLYRQAAIKALRTPGHCYVRIPYCLHFIDSTALVRRAEYSQ